MKCPQLVREAKLSREYLIITTDLTTQQIPENDNLTKMQHNGIWFWYLILRQILWRFCVNSKGNLRCVLWNIVLLWNIDVLNRPHCISHRYGVLFSTIDYFSLTRKINQKRALLDLFIMPSTTWLNTFSAKVNQINIPMKHRLGFWRMPYNSRFVWRYIEHKA